MLKKYSKKAKESNFLTRAARFFYEKALLPKSVNEDLKRREYIFNILVLACIILSGVASVIASFYFFTETNYRAQFPPMLFVIFALFSFFLILSRKGYFIPASYILVYFLLVINSHAIYVWGVDLPQVILTYALIIVISGVLINTRFAFEITLIISFIILFLYYFQANSIIFPKLYWRTELPKISDIVQFSITFFVIFIVSWLSNREIERSLKRARKSEAELKEERDTLEVRVQERTRDLEKAQMEKMNQAARFIEFGKISSGLFHDLINHMTSLFFDIEKANDAGKKEQAHAKEYLRQANETKDVLMEYIEAAKRQLQNQKTDSPFSMKKEILRIVRILGYKLKMEKVEIILMSEFDIITYGNSIKFNQVITNIVLNALDAYENSEQSRRQINIQLDKYDNKAIVSIEDWAGGISEDIQGKIFEPFFTTKGSEKGVGIGLTTVKNIIENNFGGTITFQSIRGQGTKFIIEFPIKDE